MAEWKNEKMSRTGLPDNERGQGMVEFLVVLPAMLMLIFGTIQLALIFHAKITLNYAAFEAARSGSLAHADFSEVKEGFARGLAPLYSFAGEENDQIAAFQTARKKVLDLFEEDPALVLIERLNPSDAVFQHFAPQGEIPNDNLLYRSSVPDPTDGLSIQDANLIQIRVTYWYPLYVPFVNTMIASFVCCEQGDDCKWEDDPACNPSDPRIPLTAVAALRMQTPARESTGFYQAASDEGP